MIHVLKGQIDDIEAESESDMKNAVGGISLERIFTDKIISNLYPSMDQPDRLGAAELMDFDILEAEDEEESLEITETFETPPPVLTIGKVLDDFKKSKDGKYNHKKM